MTPISTLLPESGVHRYFRLILGVVVSALAGRLASIKAQLNTLGLLIVLIVFTPSALALTMPDDLIGNYTHGSAELCKDSPTFGIEPGRVFGEGMGCDVLSVSRTWGKPGEDSDFEVALSCQMDDPKKPRLAGTLSLRKIFDRWILGVNLVVAPRERKKFSYPALQIFGKCE